MLLFVMQEQGMCGQSHWRAAKTNSKSMKKLDDTGLCLTCCRHCVLVKAINMKQGEIFAYPMFLQQHIMNKTTIGYFCQDVICRYWPWLERMASKQEEYKDLLKTKPFLSVMHGKAHDWSCQVKYIENKVIL